MAHPDSQKQGPFHHRLGHSKGPALVCRAGGFRFLRVCLQPRQGRPAVLAVDSDAILPHVQLRVSLRRFNSQCRHPELSNFASPACGPRCGGRNGESRTSAVRFSGFGREWARTVVCLESRFLATSPMRSSE